MLRFFRNPAKGPKRPGRPVSARPSLECLEDRTVPTTTWSVTNPWDSAAGAYFDKTTLRYAVLNAQSGDTIQLASNQLHGPIRLAPYLGELYLNKDLTIRASDANLKAAISGEGVCRVFEVAPNAHVTLSNLIICNGATEGFEGGAGILNHGDLKVSGCSLSGNIVYLGPGGGIANTGTLTSIDVS
jgi:hypothetical protein